VPYPSSRCTGSTTRRWRASMSASARRRALRSTSGLRGSSRTRSRPVDARKVIGALGVSENIPKLRRDRDRRRDRALR